MVWRGDSLVPCFTPSPIPPMSRTAMAASCCSPRCSGAVHSSKAVRRRRLCQAPVPCRLAKLITPISQSDTSKYPSGENRAQRSHWLESAGHADLQSRPLGGSVRFFMSDGVDGVNHYHSFSPRIAPDTGELILNERRPIASMSTDFSIV